MAVFQQKFYNPEAWAAYDSYLLQLKPTELLASGAVTTNARVAKALDEQTGTLSAILPYYSDGTEDKTTQNYDGATDIVPVQLPTYSQAFGSFGRAKAWTETDFSEDLTTAHAVNAVYARLANWKRYVVEQPAVLSILKGLFAPNAGQTQKTDFITNHTSQVSVMTPTALNDALEKAVGDNKDALSLFICHSRIATQLENAQMLNYVPYTTPAGVQTNTTLRYWNGRLLLVDNSVNDNADTGEFLGYALGSGVITLQNLVVSKPIEVARDAFKNGGMDSLIMRNRYAFGAKGFTFNTAAGAVNYTNAQLATGTNWSLISDGGTNVIPHNEVPIAKLIYKP